MDLVDDLQSDDDARQLRAVEALGQMPPKTVGEALITLMQQDISMNTSNRCMALLEKLGICVSLTTLRQDHWFEQLQQSGDATNMALVTRIVGKRYLAYSILLGIQIEQLHINERNPDLTMVNFTTDTEMVQKLPLSQFCMQVTSVLLSIGIHSEHKAVNPMTEAQALAICGEMPLLVAPLFDIFPTHVSAIQLDDRFLGMVCLDTPKGHAYLKIDEFHKLVLQLLQLDMYRFGGENLFEDLDTRAAAKAYRKRNFEEVATLLETWPAVLSTMLKSPAQKNLTAEQLEKIAEGCQLLSGAYLHTGQTAWAEEVIRLGIRYVSDTPHAWSLYLEMGLLLNVERRYGEAIGFLRRATVLSPESAEAWAALGKALRQRRRLIAAWFVLKEAQRLKAPGKKIRSDLRYVKEAFKKAKISWPG